MNSSKLAIHSDEYLNHRSHRSTANYKHRMIYIAAMYIMILYRGFQTGVKESPGGCNGVLGGPLKN